MAFTTGPRLGIKYAAGLGELWKAEMDANLRLLDRAGAHLSVKDRDLTAPPGSPANGDTYIVAASPTGAWSGQAKKIAYYSTEAGEGAGWKFYTPRAGFVAYVEDESALVAYSAAGTWGAVGGGGGGSGDVVGPASATDHAIARFDTTTGKLIQNSAITIDDSGNISGTGTANRWGAPISNNANADTMFTSSAAGKHALVVQFGDATPTVDGFRVEMSSGIACLRVQSDGGLIIDQRTGATFTNILDVRAAGTTQFTISYFGDATATRDFLTANLTGKYGIGGGRAYLAAGATDIAQINNGTMDALRDLSLRNVVAQSGYTEMVEMTAPSAGAANTARLYVDDNGSGKSRLMVIFSSGAAQQLALQP